ncbi:MAG: Gfo/Idh/MocA family oxidoreductase [Rhodospirillaceae bacterium]|nr:Gfo/Idh/MocA family oxidoreductase [Rhodospirillaceae bacterium]MBT6291493.1 Gfo/Idh/MocA family oxidoreductase [Rhodospirillaceae bacterium]
MITAGILGLGRWGRLLVGSVQGKSDHIRFAAGATRTPRKARAFAKESGLELCADYAELLARPDIDVVFIATPHSQHFGQILEAAEAGKHVFCEKPFTLDPGDTKAALEALGKAGLKAGVGFNRRFAPNTIELKRMLDEGELGKVVHIEANFSNNMSQYTKAWRNSADESPAGGMTSLGMHAVDTFIHLLGPISNLTASSRNIAMPFDVDDSTTMLMNFAAGPTGYLGTFASSTLMWRVRLFGTEGWAELRDQDRMETLLAGGKSDARVWDGYAYPALATVAAGIEEFAKAVADDRAAPISPDHIQHGIDVLGAIIASSRTNAMVSIKPA